MCSSDLSTIYNAHEINHDCVQEQCPICACIQLTKQTIKHLSLGFGRASLVPLILFIFLLSRLFMLPFLPYLTLVSQKVRMDN